MKNNLTGIFHLVLCATMSASMIASAQEVVYAPPPATKLETLETNTGTILIKATGLIGSMSVNGATVSVICKEDTDTGSGRKEYGVAIGLNAPQTGNVDDWTIVDYEEMGPLLDAVDRLGKLDWSGISLSSFSATFQTTGGFRAVAFSARRSGSIEFSVRSRRMSKGLVMTQSQLAEFRGLVDQAARKIEDLRTK